MSNSVDELLDSANAGRYDAFKFESIGTTLKGVIAEVPIVKALTNKNNGNVEDTLILAITSDDDGKTYSIFAKSPSFLLGAIADATKSAGAKLAKGGRIGIRFTELRDTGKPQPARVFVAQYAAPVESNAQVDDLLGGSSGAGSSGPDLSDVL